MRLLFILSVFMLLISGDGSPQPHVPDKGMRIFVPTPTVAPAVEIEIPVYTGVAVNEGIYYRWWNREHGKSSAGYCPYVYGAGWSNTLVYPVSGRTIYNEHGFTPKHDGIDINMPIGSPVYAAATGTVIWAGYSPYGGGFIVILAHGGGWRTAYLHLSSVSVSCGMTVAQGSLIGQSGDSATYYPHLHFEVVHGNVAQNPFRWLNEDEVVYKVKE